MEEVHSRLAVAADIDPQVELPEVDPADGQGRWAQPAIAEQDHRHHGGAAARPRPQVGLHPRREHTCERGRLHRPDTVEPGEITAWSGLVPPYQFTASGRAVENCKVAVFRSEDLSRLFDENPRFGYQFMQRLAGVAAERLRDAHLQLMGLFAS